MKWTNYMHAQMYFTTLMLVHINQAHIVTVESVLSFCLGLFLLVYHFKI